MDRSAEFRRYAGTGAPAGGRRPRAAAEAALWAEADAVRAQTGAARSAVRLLRARWDRDRALARPVAKADADGAVADAAAAAEHASAALAMLRDRLAQLPSAAAPVAGAVSPDAWECLRGALLTVALELADAQEDVAALRRDRAAAPPAARSSAVGSSHLGLARRSRAKVAAAAAAAAAAEAAEASGAREENGMAALPAERRQELAARAPALRSLLAVEVDAARDVLRQISDLAELQERFAAHVLEQTESIEQLQRTTVLAVRNVDRGADELAAAARGGHGLRSYLAALLLLLALTLLLLHLGSRPRR